MNILWLLFIVGTVSSRAVPPAFKGLNRGHLPTPPDGHLEPPKLTGDLDDAVSTYERSSEQEIRELENEVQPSRKDRIGAAVANRRNGPKEQAPPSRRDKFGAAVAKHKKGPKEAVAPPTRKEKITNAVANQKNRKEVATPSHKNRVANAAANHGKVHRKEGKGKVSPTRKDKFGAAVANRRNGPKDEIPMRENTGSENGKKGWGLGSIFGGGGNSQSSGGIFNDLKNKALDAAGFGTPKAKAPSGGIFNDLKDKVLDAAGFGTAEAKAPSGGGSIVNTFMKQAIEHIGGGKGNEPSGGIMKTITDLVSGILQEGGTGNKPSGQDDLFAKIKEIAAKYLGEGKLDVTDAPNAEKTQLEGIVTDFANKVAGDVVVRAKAAATNLIPELKSMVKATVLSKIDFIPFIPKGPDPNPELLMQKITNAAQLFANDITGDIMKRVNEMAAGEGMEVSAEELARKLGFQKIPTHQQPEETETVMTPAEKRYRQEGADYIKRLKAKTTAVPPQDDPKAIPPNEAPAGPEDPAPEEPTRDITYQDPDAVPDTPAEEPDAPEAPTQEDTDEVPSEEYGTGFEDTPAEEPQEPESPTQEDTDGEPPMEYGTGAEDTPEEVPDAPDLPAEDAPVQDENYNDDEKKTAHDVPSPNEILQDQTFTEYDLSAAPEVPAAPGDEDYLPGYRPDDDGEITPDETVGADDDVTGDDPNSDDPTEDEGDGDDDDEEVDEPNDEPEEVDPNVGDDDEDAEDDEPDNGDGPYEVDPDEDEDGDDNGDAPIETYVEDPEEDDKTLGDGHYDHLEDEYPELGDGDYADLGTGEGTGNDDPEEVMYPDEDGTDGNDGPMETDVFGDVVTDDTDEGNSDDLEDVDNDLQENPDGIPPDVKPLPGDYEDETPKPRKRKPSKNDLQHLGKGKYKGKKPSKHHKVTDKDLQSLRKRKLSEAHRQQMEKGLNGRGKPKKAQIHQKAVAARNKKRGGKAKARGGHGQGQAGGRRDKPTKQEVRRTLSAGTGAKAKQGKVRRNGKDYQGKAVVVPKPKKISRPRYGSHFV